MKLLIIEDDETVARSLQRGLKSALHTVDIALTGKDGIALALVNDYDLIILDYYLPDANGKEIAEVIREKKPSILIIALSNEQNIEIKVEMLALCDDYVVKPFSIEELTARIQAVSRRDAKVYGQVFCVDGLEVCTKSHVVKCDGKIVALSNKEFILLRYLMDNIGRVLSRNIILEKVWDVNADPFTNTVDVHVQRLRAKIGPRGKEFIITVHGIGYKFVDPSMGEL